MSLKVIIKILNNNKAFCILLKLNIKVILCGFIAFIN